MYTQDIMKDLIVIQIKIVLLIHLPLDHSIDLLVILEVNFNIHQAMSLPLSLHSMLHKIYVEEVPVINGIDSILLYLILDTPSMV